MGQRLGAVAEIVQILPIEGVGVDAGNCQLLKQFGKAGGQQLRAGDLAALKLPPERLVDLLVEVIGGLGEGKAVVGKGALQGLTLGGRESPSASRRHRAEECRIASKSLLKILFSSC